MSTARTIDRHHNQQPPFSTTTSVAPPSPPFFPFPCPSALTLLPPRGRLPIIAPDDGCDDPSDLVVRDIDDVLEFCCTVGGGEGAIWGRGRFDEGGGRAAGARVLHSQRLEGRI